MAVNENMQILLSGGEDDQARGGVSNRYKPQKHIFHRRPLAQMLKQTKSYLRLDWDLSSNTMQFIICKLRKIIAHD